MNDQTKQEELRKARRARRSLRKREAEKPVVEPEHDTRPITLLEVMRWRDVELMKEQVQLRGGKR